MSTGDFPDENDGASFRIEEEGEITLTEQGKPLLLEELRPFPSVSEEHISAAELHISAMEEKSNALTVDPDESTIVPLIKPTGNESTGDDANNNAHNNAQRDTVVMSAGSKSRAGSPTDEQIQRLDEKTGMVTGKMKNNLDEIMKREVALDDLEQTAGDLAENAKQFHQTSQKVNRMMWCRNHKWHFIIGCTVVVILVGVTLAVAGSMGAFK